jgi:hypothetical protein
VARTGMTALLEELRGLVEAGTSEYTVGTTLFWSDNALQDVLDMHRIDLMHMQLQPFPTVMSGGTLQWFEYRSPHKFLETTTGGSEIFYLQDSTGATAGTDLWSADYRRGVITFSADTLGTAYFVTGRSYDLNAAAAEVWRKKASHYAPTSFNFSTDNHSISREQVYTHCMEMAQFFDGISNTAIQTIQTYRSDLSVDVD